MMTPTLLYQQMKKWVATDESRPVFQHIYYDGHRALATDGHRMAIVKNYPVQEPHWETPAGVRPPDTEDWTAPNFDRVIPKKEACEWVMEMELPVGAVKGILLHWKNSVEYMKKTAKDHEYSASVLQKIGNRLCIYAANRYIRAKAILLEKLPDGEQDVGWMAGYNTSYLLDCVDFVKATDPRDLSVYIGNRDTLVMETEDILLVVVPIRMNPKKNTETQRLLDFVRDETPSVAEPEAEEETPDFLK